MHDRKLEEMREEDDRKMREYVDSLTRELNEDTFNASEHRKAVGSGRTIGVDFDGVLHSYRTPIELGEQHLVKDPPVEGALEWMQNLVQHFDVVIYTARHASPGGLKATRDWLKKWGFPEVPVTGIKPIAKLYIDDRGYAFTGNNFPSVEYLQEFKPWNRVVNWDREQ